MHPSLRTFPFLAALVGAAPASPPAAPTLPRVVPNDNRVPAGRRHGDTLELHLVLTMATWRPEADSGPAIDVAAFAEEGKAPSIPGPLVRVREGTLIDATVRNGLADSTITLFGMETRPGAQADSVVLRPGESRRLTFAAGVPGTYFYLANVGHRDFAKGDERETSSGAFIVDPRAGSPPDRIWMMNIWGHTVDTSTYQNALAINGRSWPYTEPITTTVGDTLRWRIINATVRPHPMHLHGFFFRVDGRGDAFTDTAYTDDGKMQEVTEGMRGFSTYRMTWSPDRPGNWVYHCHIAYHVTDFATLEPPSEPDDPRTMSHDPRVHMAGLVLGITVQPRRGERVADPAPGRKLDLFVDAGRRAGLSPHPMGYVLQEGPRPPAPDSIGVTSPVLVLTEGVPTDIAVHNRLPASTAVHWHGIELQSWSDGVVQWSGSPGHVAPAIAPGDSFTAHLLLPRAGTFIYHTHLSDFDQLRGGLYGAIVVLPPGETFDTTTDHLFLAGEDGSFHGPDRTLVNGDTAAPPLHLKAGVMQRLRFINIGPADGFMIQLRRDSVPVKWWRFAKDGADLPPALQVEVPATVRLRVGETVDYRFRPDSGVWRLVFFQDPAHPLYQRELVADP